MKKQSTSSKLPSVPPASTTRTIPAAAVPAAAPAVAPAPAVAVASAPVPVSAPPTGAIKPGVPLPAPGPISSTPTAAKPQSLKQQHQQTKQQPQSKFLMGGESSSTMMSSGTAGTIHMSGSMNWEPVRKRLLGPDLRDALAAATELREGIEIVHTTEFPLMLSALLPAFSNILAHRMSPTPNNTTLEHRLRNVVLEIISRMPCNEVLRPHAPYLVAVALDVLNRDYEENALLASRLIFDLYKVYRSLPQDHVQPYLDFVQSAYRNLPGAVQRNFLFPALAAGPAPSSSSSPPAQDPSSQGFNMSSASLSSLGADKDTTKNLSSIAFTPPGKSSTTPTITATMPATTMVTTTPPPEKRLQSSAGTPSASLMRAPSDGTLGSLSVTPMSGLPASPVAISALRSNSSFRVLTECPLIVMLMFQLYPKFLKTNIPVLIKVMTEALALRAPPLQSIVTPPNQKLDSNGQRLYGSRCRELVAAQAKTLSFLTYLLRGFANELKPYEDRLATNAVALMSVCPREFISTRKELLVATRHLLNSDFRKGFFRHVDALLDERVLMGSHHRYSDQTILRPLGYMTLSDLVHHVRSSLTMSQLSRVVSTFSRVLHDPSMTLPMSTQYAAVRTLLSVVDIAFNNKDRNPQIGRDILVRILKTLVDKLATLKDYYPLELPASSEAETRSSMKNSVEQSQTPLQESNEMTTGDSKQKHKSDSQAVSAKWELPLGTDPAESIRDLKSMVRAIIVGNKTVIWYINNYRAQRDKEKIENLPPPIGSNEEVASAMLKMTHTEHGLIDQYIFLALPCMKLLNQHVSTGKGESSAATSSLPSTTAGSPNAPQSPHSKKVPSDASSISATSAMPDQYRDALTYFAAAFTTLDGNDLRKTLGRRLDFLVDTIVDDPPVMLVPRHLLGSNATTSFEFCSVLLDFLVARMDELAMVRQENVVYVPDTPSVDGNESRRLKNLSDKAFNGQPESSDLRASRSTTHLQLFERVLKSLSVFPENEAALRPHLRTIVSTCLRSSTEKSDFKTDNYCMLLRYLFRSISAGKFEESYKELLPLIPTALNGLYRMLMSTDDQFHHFTTIELFLTIPARLSSLLPHMNLLLRIIVRALRSNSGDLVNLGLRTLEFWVDNLNPEFLYPELSKQGDLFIQLTEALATHLRPAPYPYGLLTLRLLGKLGGKNRRVLREPIDIYDPLAPKDCTTRMFVDCKWAIPNSSSMPPSGEPSVTHERPSIEKKSQDSGMCESFPLPLPLDRCVDVLKGMALSQEMYEANLSNALRNCESERGSSLSWKESEKLWRIDIEKIDLLPYCRDVIKETKRTQVQSALSVLRSSLMTILDVEKFSIEVTASAASSNAPDAFTRDELDPNMADAAYGLHSASLDRQVIDTHLQTISIGIMFACTLDAVQKEAMTLLKGLCTHLFLITLHHHHSIVRIDANGSSIVQQGALSAGNAHDNERLDLFEGGLGSLKPFGYFQQIGDLQRKGNPMALNKALAKFLTVATPSSNAVGLEVLRHILNLPRRMRVDSIGPAPKHRYISRFDALDRGSLIYFESLLSLMCEQCISSYWNKREGIYDAICTIIETLGATWSRKYEMEIMNVALFSLKSSPREMAAATTRAFQFLVRVCNGLYGPSNHQRHGKEGFIWDVLSVDGGKDEADRASNTDNRATSATDRRISPCNDVLQVLVTELASTKQIVRFACRFVIKQFVINESSPTYNRELFRKQLALIRRVVFSRSLRLLPLPEQVGAVEALAVVVGQVPEVISLTDQHLLAFLSELLKMSSVADGEMSDSNLTGYVVDKNGNAVSARDSNSASQGDKNADSKINKAMVCCPQASSIFLRRESIVRVGDLKIVVAEELPSGVQLRVSSICLLRSVIRGHPDTFFDAETSTPIGNIRPHVISLLFRSLVSCPRKSVEAAHDALRDVLTLSMMSKGSSDVPKSKSRLPKELLQTCIRPVLLNLREYTRLSVFMLRGLARLLSLLSSWFNKTLGEKLLDHLQKWTDPNRIKAHKIWKEGQEPNVAAAIIDLFALLPHASHFVELLVKTTIKLEGCLPAFKARHVLSPYRKPLARYLNKHCQYTISFFFPRLKTPLYSELFQDVLKFEECKALREYLSGRQCSVTLLNVCFERPLAIIRSEKTTSSSSGGLQASKSPSGYSTSELYTIHGIRADSTSLAQQEVILRQDLDNKKKKFQSLQQDLDRAKETVQNKAIASASGSSSAETQASLEEAKRQQKLAKSAYDRAAKELNDSKQRYAATVSSLKAIKSGKKSDGTPTIRPMDIESLELQYQGFRLVETLMTYDENYLKFHNDVLRAFRWLWRSKGRYLRLQHEESVAPRYHGESKMLASFLVDYSMKFPSDVDVLFELIRIFLQSTTNDFSFVKSFLADAVSEKLTISQRKQIIQRFFALLAGESTEEIKTLSIQLVVYPMLLVCFQGSAKQKICHSVEMALETKTNVQAASSSIDTSGDFLDGAVVRKFVKEVLFQDGKTILCGDRLKVELLRMSNLLLEHVPKYVEEFGSYIIKFCWSLLKSDDTSCKSWAYLVVCRYISVFATPSKIILQVYVALLRSHQQEGRDLVRAALDLLVPALPKRFADQEFIRVVEYTNRIMFEEGNSVPQLAHIWHTITNHSLVFYAHRHHFVRYMVNSLNRLGLPPNCPPENRSLAVAVVELVMQWDERQRRLAGEPTAASLKTAIHSKRKAPENDSVASVGGSAEKKRKTSSQGAFSVGGRSSDDGRLVLDHSMVDTITNFLIRLKVLLADQKVDAGMGNIDARLTTLFRKVASRWQQCAIRPAYFEKVVSMCKEDNATEQSAGKVAEKPKVKASGKTTAKTTKSTSSIAPSSAAAKSDSKLVTSAVLSSCLDIFIVLAEVAPSNVFLIENSSQLKEIIAACFSYARQSQEHTLRQKLRRCVSKLLVIENPKVHGNVMMHINVLLEQCLVDAEVEYRRSIRTSHSVTEPVRQASGKGRSAAADEENTDACTASFVLDIIEDVCRTRMAYIKTFSSSLLALANTLVKNHISAASAKQKQGGASYAPQAGTSSIRQMFHTPVEGILAESASKDGNLFAASGASKTASSQVPYPAQELKDFDETLRSTVIILRILGSSDLPYSFTQDRKTLFQIISSILDSSNNVQVLMEAVRLVGKWLLSDVSGGPLTIKERNSFLWKIASFDFNGLPDIVSQPLADLVAHYVIAFLSGRTLTMSLPTILGQENISEENTTRLNRVRQRVSDSDDMIMGRSLVACLLTANHILREDLLSLYASQSCDATRSRQLLQISGKSKDKERPQIPFPARSPLEVLWQLFHSDFEGLGGRSWIVIFVELLLANICPTLDIHLADNTLLQSVGDKHQKMDWLPRPQNHPRVANPVQCEASLQDEYAEFCEILIEEKRDYCSGGDRFLKALRRLAHGDVCTCQQLFEALLPAAWEKVPNDGMRLRLVPAMESLLSRPFHSQLLRCRDGRRHEQRSINVVRSFLNVVTMLAPLPTLDIDLLVYLSENYNCWYEVLSLLEQQSIVLASRCISSEGIALKEKNLMAMRHCYRQLGETNIWMSLALRSCRVPETSHAVSLDLYGMTNEAVESYNVLVELVESGTLDPTNSEMDLWEERWIEIQREHCQLQVVAEYAKSVDDPRLLLEHAWKHKDWDRVRALCNSSSLVAAVEGGDPVIKLSETLLAVADGKLSDVENLHAQTAQLCLYKWQLLPDLASGSLVHVSLLHFFHRLVEIRESGQIMVETSNHSQGQTLPDLRNLLNAWRHRLPNDYERLTVWDEVFTWRSHMFSAILSNFHWSEPTALANVHDRPWTAIRIAKTARKQGLRHVALLLLNQLTESRSMDVSDAFMKLREQILGYQNPESDLERTGGLNLINTTNLSFFDPPQKSELFRLKAIFLASLGGRSKSNQAYCHAVQICPTHARAWVSWGGLCSSLGALTEKQAEKNLSKMSTEQAKESRANFSKKVAQYLAQAMGCYLEAVQIDAHEKSRIHIPKCLWMLTKDGSSPSVLCQTLENRGSALPAWVWLPWIPQLLTSLCRIEGRAIKTILSRLVKCYPQAVYYSLRAFYLERRDVERSKGISSSSSQQMSSVAYAEEMMSTLRRSHASLWSSLEAILEELIVKFRPSYEEELLATISALLERAESHSEKQALPDKTRLEDEDAMVASWSKTLSRIAAKFFRSSDSSSSSNRRDERVKKTAEFKRKYKSDFEEDFRVKSAEGQSETTLVDSKPQFRLEEYVTRLQKWKRKLECQVAGTPIALPLIESSHSLAMFAGDMPDLWPGSCDPRQLNARSDLAKDQETETAGTQSSTSSSASAARKAAETAAVAAANAAAKEGVGGEYGGGSASIEIPGQYCPNACASADVRPSPELHAKLMRFEPFVQVLRRNDQLVRRAGMIGSDGRTYRFLLQFAIPYWTRTDERTAQTQYIIDKFLRESVGTARNHLSVQPSAAIPVAQRLRMTLDLDSRMSLDEVFRLSYDRVNKRYECIPTYFFEQLADRLKDKITIESSAEEKQALENSERLEVFHHICKTKVDNGILLRHMQSILDGPEPLFQFRRAFAAQLAANSLLQYAFSAAERSPPRFVMIQCNARVLSPDFRVSYTNQGFIEGQDMPYRMTPNIVALIGQVHLDGRFIPTMANVAEAIREHKDEFDPILRLLMRDDILAWYSKSLAKSDSKTQELEKQLLERVSKNVDTLQSKFAECAPRKQTGTDNAKKDPVDKKVRELLGAATDPAKLCMMPASYHAWL